MTNGTSRQVVVGTGGLGSGMFLDLEGNASLGREESRAARRLDRSDRCKLHIISHYIRTFLGPDTRVVLIGRIGHDDPGREVLAELVGTGLDTTYVQVSADLPTTYSICFTYPDGAGGNITVADSASSAVSVADVDAAREAFDPRWRGIAFAAPEVPLAARRRLLELATDAGYLRVASFLTAELTEPDTLALLEMVDVVALNVDEAAGLLTADEQPPADHGTAADPEPTVRRAVDRLRRLNPGLRMVITAGRHGSWTWDGVSLERVRPIAVEAISTAGAGDAHLAGVIVGLACGAGLRESNEFATLVSGQKVTCPDTIDPTVDLESTIATAVRHGRTIAPAILSALH